MKSDLSAHFVIRVALMTLAFATKGAVANAEDAASKLQSIAKINDLDVAGKPPFHIKLSFQLYGLNGTASDTGTVEEWWSAPSSSKTVVTAASLKSTEAIDLNSATQLDPREHYFIHELLMAAVHPVSIGTSSSNVLKTEEHDRVFSGITLNCFSVAPSDSQGSGRQLFSYCTEKNTDALRFHLEGALSSMARNQVGSFHDTEVALGIEIAYSDRLAITGKVTTMQGFDPTKSAVQLTSPDAESLVDSDTQHVGLGLGHIINKVQPEYPSVAKAGHISGTVVLHATISKEGKIAKPFVLASQHAALNEAAIDAVKQWTYQPYLLDGKPVEVETVINVNFMFGGGH